MDWQKVYDHFSERKHLDLLFYESDIQKSIDKMVEEKVIELEVTVEGIGGGSDGCRARGGHETVRQLIFDKFFEATFQARRSRGGRHGRTTSSTRSRTFTRTR